MACVFLTEEIAALDLVDPTNRIEPAPHDNPPFKLIKPLALPTTEGMWLQILSTTNAEQIATPEGRTATLANGTVVALFDPKGAEVSVRTRLCTKVAIAVECQQADWQALDKAMDETFSAVWDQFVQAYRMITTDVRPPLWDDNHRLIFLKQGWAPYDPADATKDPFVRVQLPQAQLAVSKNRLMVTYHKDGSFDFNQAEVAARMLAFFGKKTPVPLSRETLARAHRSVNKHRSGKTAVIEATIALEIAVSHVLDGLKLQKGVSKGKLKELRKEVGIGYQLNVEVPILFGPLTDQQRGILGEADKVRKTRNLIVHEGQEVTREEGEEAVKAVRALLEFFWSRGFEV